MYGNIGIKEPPGRGRCLLVSLCRLQKKKAGLLTGTERLEEEAQEIRRSLPLLTEPTLHNYPDPFFRAAVLHPSICPPLFPAGVC